MLSLPQMEIWYLVRGSTSSKKWSMYESYLKKKVLKFSHAVKKVNMLHTLSSSQVPIKKDAKMHG